MTATQHSREERLCREIVLPFLSFLHNVSLAREQFGVNLFHSSQERGYVIEWISPHTSPATMCRTAYLDTAISAARLPS